MRGVLSIVLAVAAAYFLWEYLRVPVDKPLVDFKAFYCASRAMLAGHDPYALLSVAACERAPGPAGTFVAGVSNIIPAPLPGYVLLFFAPLAALSYDLAAPLEIALACASVAGAVLLTIRSTQLPRAAVAAMLLPAGLIVGVVTGQTAPFALFGIALAAGSTTRAVRIAGLALALLQPNIGFPIALALALFDRDMRLPVCTLAGSLAVATVLALGPAAAGAYVFQTIPSAASNAAYDPTEYGTIWFAHALGLAAPLAVSVGTVTSLAGAILGVIVAGRLAKRFENAGLLVTIPPLFTVVFAGYLHEAQFALAIPAALALASISRGTARVVAIVSALAIGLPWAELTVLDGNFSLIAGVVASAAIVPIALRASSVVTQATVLAVFALACAVGFSSPRVRFARAAPLLGETPVTTEERWGELQRLVIVDGIAAMIGIKAVSTLGVAGATVLALARARSRARRSDAPAGQADAMSPASP